MTTLDLLKFEIDEAGAQIERSIDGLGEADADYRVADHAMSFRELMIHLCDVYKAIPAQLAGAEYEWGSFAPPSTEWPALVETMKSMRLEAIKEVLADNDERLRQEPAFSWVTTTTMWDRS